MGKAEDFARKVFSARADQLGSQIRERYGIFPNEDDQYPAVPAWMFTEQLLLNAGFEVGSYGLQNEMRAKAREAR